MVRRTSYMLFFAEMMSMHFSSDIRSSGRHNPFETHQTHEGDILHCQHVLAIKQGSSSSDDPSDVPAVLRSIS